MKKRLYVMAIIITLLVSALIVNVQAAELSCKASMKLNTENVEKGKNVIITLDVSDINAGKKGINSLKGNLEFDDKVFEEISDDAIEGSNDWNATYSEDSGKLTLLKTSFVKDDEDVCQITLKVKSKATAKKGTVEFKNIEVSNSEDEPIKVEDISLDVEIGSEEDDNENKNTNSNTNKSKNNTITITSNKNNTNKNTNTNTNKTSNTNTNRNNVNKNNINNTNKNVNNSNVTNETTDDMPNTGIDDTIVKAMILVTLVGAVGYMKMKSLDQK